MKPSMLYSICENIWHAQHAFKVIGLPMSTRMTIVRLSDGALWVHSPIPVDDALQAQIEALGTVRYVVAPSKTHHLFAKKFVQRFPGAQLFGPPGLAKKRADIQNLITLNADEKYPWQPELDFHLFAGFPLMNESVWHHTPSQTLILTDLCQMWRSNKALTTGFYNTLMGVQGRFAVPRSVRWLVVKDKNAAGKSAARVLEWPIDRIVMCHDSIIESNAHAELERAFKVFSNPKSAS